jgi:amidase
METVLHCSVHQLAATIRSREVSAAEVVDGHLARIRSRNPALNPIVTLDEAGARRNARLADGAR